MYIIIIYELYMNLKHQPLVTKFTFK